MKKIIFSLIVFSFLILGLSALAQNNDLPDPGLTPDSPFYFLKSWKESIQTFFTFGEENKAKQFLHLSEIRLAEYQKMVDKGKTEIAQKTLEKYEKQLNHALEKADQAQEKGKDVEKLKETISEKILKHQEVLEGVLEKVPEEAKEGIRKAIEASQKGFEKAIEAVTGEKKEELERRSNVIANVEPLFGTMIAFNINDAVMNTPGMIDTLQKGWTEFRKDESAYQNLLSNLEKLIQDRTKLVKATGFSIDREAVAGYFTWNVLEPQKGQFDWELTDIYVKETSNAGVKIFAVIQPFAGWDQKNTKPSNEMLDFAYYDYKASPPKDIAEYQNFLTKMVERYKDKVAVWEIGNEPENPGSGYQNNPEGYFGLVKITSETIKKADPQAKVTNGGAMEIVGMRESDSFKAYWTKFFALGGGQYLDYFNIHYNIEHSQGAKLDLATFEKNLASFNDLIDKSAQGGGGRKPLYLTEFGIYSGLPSYQPPGQSAQGIGQTQTNLPTQSPPSAQSPNLSSGGECGDNICDDFEKQNPNACPQDCGENVSSVNQGQPSGQPVQGQTPVQNVQPNQGQTLRNISENEQATLYFKYSILAFADGVKMVFIDLIGKEGDIIGSSALFNPEGQPRLFLTSLKTIDSKIQGFSKVEKNADGQYKFTVGSKTVYALWSGTLPNEISGKVKVTDIKGKEQLMDAAGIKLKTDQPVLIELQR